VLCTHVKCGMDVDGRSNSLVPRTFLLNKHPYS